jgi:hypothetical protein
MSDDDDDNMSPSLLAKPSLPWRAGSAATIGFIGSIARSFLYGLNQIEVTGLEGFLEILEKRKNVEGRERGLITGRKLGTSAWTRDSADHLVNSIKSCQRVCYHH